MASTSSGVVILGGGFAGLACGAALAAEGRPVVLLEKKPHLGGRAYSFRDTETGDSVDNGQHLFMGCYRETRAFLERIGTADKMRLASDIRVDYADAAGGRDALVCPTALGAPLHLAAGVLGLKGISIGDKLGLIRLDLKLRALRGRDPMPAELDTMTVRQWLGSLGQSARIQERLFDPIALGALNDDPGVAAATGFAQVLTRAFYDGVEGSKLGLATVGLSELYTEAARAYIETRGGAVHLNKKVKSVSEGKVVCEDGSEFQGSHVVSTLPPWDLLKLELPASLRGPWEKLKPAPIVSISLWLDREVISEPLIGLLGTEIQWVFNKTRIHSLPGGGQYLALVISGAHKQVAADPKLLLEIAKRDLARCFPEFQKATIKRWKVVKEPFATLSPVPGSDALRPSAKSGTPGFVFAGDWTQTGLPATIESAVLSGRRAAQLILNGGN
jgi:squalene-associated FAD-dependent desaturase